MGCTNSAHVDRTSTGPTAEQQAREPQSLTSPLPTKARPGAHGPAQVAVTAGQHASAHDGAPQRDGKQRRQAFGSEVVRKAAAALTPAGGDGDVVSESSDDDQGDVDFTRESSNCDRPSAGGAPVGQLAQVDRVSAALETSFVFRGTDRRVLRQVVKNMKKISFKQGEFILVQNEAPKQTDCLYFLDTGEVDVVIRGSGDSSGQQEGSMNNDRNELRIHKLPGWVFGDVALLFNSPRSASVVASTDVMLWALDRRNFLKFVMKHAPGARMLQFVRKVPMLKGLSDNALIRVAARLTTETYEDGQYIIKYGERGNDRFYLIRYGKVGILRPETAESTKRGVVAVLGRGQFVGQRTMATGKLRSADCVAQGQVEVVVLSKRDFQDLDNPLLAWMLDFDAVSTVLRGIAATNPKLRIAQEKQEEAVDQFVREDYKAGDVIVAEGRPLDRLYIVKSGEVAAQARSGAALALPETGGFTHFGEQVMQSAQASPVTVTVRSETAVVLTLPHSSLLQQMETQKPATPTADVAVASRGGAGAAKPGAAVPASRSTMAQVSYWDLETHRVVGTGQFGSVRLVRHKRTGTVYALKAMQKHTISESKQVEHVVNERRIMEEARHPFCVQLVRAYQDKTQLYLLLEWVAGGELFHHLDLEGAFDEPTATFYAANVLVALEYLHARGIVYRDLKPENLLLDPQGYIKVADFGFAKKIGAERTYTICGTPDYQAPEVIMRRGTTKAADYWALGVLIFEMLVGDPPFKSLTGDPWDTFRRTLSGRFVVPNFIGDTAADLIYKLLQVNPERRLGSGPRGAEDIRAHPLFEKIDWVKLEARHLPAPIRPTVSDPLDTNNFDTFDGNEHLPPPPGDRVDRNADAWKLWDWIDEEPRSAGGAAARGGRS